MSEKPGTYATLMQMLHRICWGEDCWAEESLLTKLMEYGWIKAKRTVAMTPVNGLLPSSLYCLTEKGHFMLAPRENGVEGLPVPFFATKNRNHWLSPDGEQLLSHEAYLSEAAR